MYRAIILLLFTAVLCVQSEVIDFTAWTLTGNGVGPARAISKSVLVITPPVNSVTNAAYSPFMLDVSQSFQVTFNLGLSGTNAADGVSFLVSNDPRGRAAFGSSGGALGVFGVNAANTVAPSFAFAIRDYSPCVGFCGGPVLTSAAPSPALPSLTLGPSLTNNLTVSLAYSPCNGGW